ncbi:hypothetical protein POTOM_006743 [Populus tomentosa]|uniref:DDRGK domain-containing protein 1 n=1 Tax=Populus tomentosa TaxID=118781 RepID=A0A8X8APF6_POPTO|nr:hypothetical protein POTOM_006743 [Populus tomentosa]
MEELFVLILSMLLVVGLIPLYLWKRRQDRSQDEPQQQEERQVPRGETVVRATGTRRMRRRPAAGASSSRNVEATVEVYGIVECADAGAESDDEVVGGAYHEDKASKKEKKRQEREAQRQAEEAARDSRLTKQDRYAEIRRRKEEEREAKERMLEEEAKARQAKEEETAALEFDKWKGEFSVDAEGSTGNDLQDGNQDLLSDFVEYIKKHKCLPLEDLAAEFKLRTQFLNNDRSELNLFTILIHWLFHYMHLVVQECINRITSLESMGRLSGVMDDRGKYIYISQEEMRAVADYIKRQGRVSISHLASKSNQFIDLETKAQFVEEISNAEELTVA